MDAAAHGRGSYASIPEGGTVAMQGHGFEGGDGYDDDNDDDDNNDDDDDDEEEEEEHPAYMDAPVDVLRRGIGELFPETTATGTSIEFDNCELDGAEPLDELDSPSRAVSGGDDGLDHGSVARGANAADGTPISAPSAPEGLEGSPKASGEHHSSDDPTSGAYEAMSLDAGGNGARNTAPPPLDSTAQLEAAIAAAEPSVLETILLRNGFVKVQDYQKTIPAAMPSKDAASWSQATSENKGSRRGPRKRKPGGYPCPHCSRVYDKECNRT